MRPGPDAPERAGTPAPQALPVTDPEALWDLHETLLVPNFPASELISAEELVAAVAGGTASAWVVGSVADPAAVAITESLDPSPAVLLAYLATRQDLRGQGIGTSLLRELLAGIHADPAVSVVLAEVEHPGLHRAHPVHGDPAARLRFYGRIGGLALGLPYFQPPVDATQDPVHGMLLLVLDPPARWVRPGPGPGSPGRLAPEAGLAAALEGIMAGVDPGVLPVESALAPTRDPDGVRLWPLDHLDEVPVSRRPPRPLPG